MTITFARMAPTPRELAQRIIIDACRRNGCTEQQVLGDYRNPKAVKACEEACEDLLALDWETKRIAIKLNRSQGWVSTIRKHWQMRSTSRRAAFGTGTVVRLRG